MISFVKKIADTKPEAPQTEGNRFEHIRQKAAEGHKKSDMDGARRRARQTVEDNRLL